jgi:hypothetical protein
VSERTWSLFDYLPYEDYKDIHTRPAEKQPIPKFIGIMIEMVIIKGH